MAISINRVYQKVLAIANKEQRGYITPQEFNLFADLAQKEVFEQYFYDINQKGNVPGNSTEFSDQLYILEEKIAPFRVNNKSLISSTQLFIGNGVDYSSFEHGTFQVVGNGSATLPQFGWGTNSPTNVSVVANANNNYTPSLKLTNIGQADASIHWNNGDDDSVHGLTGLVVGKDYEISVTVSYVDVDDDIGPEIKVQLANEVGDASPSPTSLSYVALVGNKTFIAKATATAQSFRIVLDEVSAADENNANYAEVHFSEISIRQVDNNTLSSDVYRLGEVLYNSPLTTFDTPIAEVDTNQLTTYNLSPLARPTTRNPVFVRTGANSISIHPNVLETASSVSYNYIKSPSEPNWTYNIVLNKALYDATDSDLQDFELHASEEDTLVYKILQLAGISMAKQDITASAQGKEIQEVSQQK
tara:strand:- start:1173 stop:2423 length:1251 start_codon:yes stop_codon:yes gene_type:complete